MSRGEGAPTRRPSGLRRLVFKMTAVAIPLASLFLLEAGLRVAGFGHSYPLFIESEEDSGYLRVNPRIVDRFVVDENDRPNLWIRPVYFPKEKGRATIRIFVQGGSTAAGYPYGYGASPAGMLQQRLQRTFPERKVEVITTAVSAVNSYTLLDFTDEIIEREPDAVLIYAGHNEYLGLLGVGSGYSVGRWRPLVLAFLSLRELRICQLAQRAIASFRATGNEKKRDRRRTLMATIAKEKRIPYGSDLFQRGLDQYRANLKAILARYRAAQVPVFIGTLVSNEADQPPFLSGNSARADRQAWSRHFETGRRALESGDARLALKSFDEAIAVDDSQAQGHYGRGQALLSLGRAGDARQAFLAAKDRDLLRFRAPEDINRVIREEAAWGGAQVVEVQAAFETAAANGIVGKDLMLEHLHPNLRGYFLLADAFYQALRKNALFGTWVNSIPADVAWTEAPVTEVDRLYGEYRILKLMSDWPFSERPVRVPIPAATSVVERIAQGYYRGEMIWPEAMQALLDHYRARGQDIEAARVAVLLAEAFPFDENRQNLAVETLQKAGRPDSAVYRSRISRPEDPGH